MTPEWSAGDSKVVISKFRRALLAAPGVTQVALHPAGSKEKQGNIGNHYQDWNFAVHTKTSGGKYLEFELTRHQHQDNAEHFTVSALFKMPPKNIAKDAWMILRAACMQNALLPGIVNENFNKALRAMGEDEPEDAGFATSQASSSKATGVLHVPNVPPGTPALLVGATTKGKMPSGQAAVLHTSDALPTTVPMLSAQLVKSPPVLLQPPRPVAVLDTGSAMSDSSRSGGMLPPPPLAPAVPDMSSAMTVERWNMPAVLPPPPRPPSVPNTGSAMFAVPGPALSQGGWNSNRVFGFPTGSAVADASTPVVPSLLAEQVAAQPVVAPNSAPSPPQAAAVRPGIDDSVLSDDEADVVDWGPDGAADEQQVGPPLAEVDVEQFRAAPFADQAPHVQIAGPVSDSPLERLGLEAAQVSADLFPDFLQPEQAQREIGESRSLRGMQELKAKAMEQVRYRVVEVSALDPYAAASVGELRRVLAQKMKSQAYDRIREVGHLADLHSEKAPGSARASTVSACDFLDAAHKRGLEVTHFKHDTRQARELQAKYKKLIQQLPQTVYDKCGTLETPGEKFAAVAKLINKHGGELVEPDLTTAYWRLIPVGPGFARWDWGEQFVCFESGQQAPANFTAQEHELYAKQWKPTLAGQKGLLMVCNNDINTVANQTNISREDLRPYWVDMRFRHVCPCKNTEEYTWIRSHSVISLGELLMILGTDYTAAEIYSLYRILRVVCLKRRKDRCSARGGPPSSGSRVSGMAGAAVKREFKSSKELLIDEYATLMAQALPGDNDKEAREALFQKAVQYIHLNLLQDLSPPWIERQFSQALPGNGVLCRYLKPTFVRWMLPELSLLFGKDVLDAWRHRCHCVGLELVSLVGRPLYTCSCTLPNGKVCGAIAAMSPLVQKREDNRPFMCKRCATRQPREHQALPVMRMVRLYAQVEVQDKVVAMRTVPMHILIHAPKNDAAWGIGHEVPNDMLNITMAKPTKLELFHESGYKYNERDSQNIWMHATHFQHVED